MAKKEKALPSWRVTRIKGKASDLGTFQAKDAEAAVKKAATSLEIPPAEQWRLSAYRVA